MARYTVDMGGSIELLETALRVPPWQPMYALAAEELRRMRLTTLDSEEGIPLIGANALVRANSNAPGFPAPIGNR